MDDMAQLTWQQPSTSMTRINASIKLYVHLVNIGNHAPFEAAFVIQYRG